MSKPLIAIHTGGSILYLSNFDTATSYSVKNPLNMPAAAKRSDVEEGLRYGNPMTGTAWRDMAERSMDVYCLGTDAGTAEDALTALQVAIDTPGARLLWQRESTSRMLVADILSAQLTEARVDLVRRDLGKIPVDLTLVTSGDWYEYDGIAISDTSITDCGTFDITDVRGDRPARTSLSIVGASAGNAVGVGIKPSPGTNFDPIDDYTAAAAYTLPASLPTDGTMAYTPPSLDAADNAQTCEVMVKSAGPVGDVMLRTRSIMAGSGSLSTVTVSGYSESVQTKTSATAGWHRVGQARVPAAALPSGLDSGWGAGQTAHSTGALSGSWPTYDGGYQARVYQTFTVTKPTRAISVTFTRKRTSTGLFLGYASLWNTSAGSPSTIISSSDTNFSVTSGTEASTTVAVQSGQLAAGTYAVVLQLAEMESTGLDIAFKRDTAAGYAGGAAGYWDGSQWVAGDGTDSTVDLAFTLDYEEYTSPSASLGIQAAYVGTSGSLDTDYLVRVPCDHGCTLIGYGFGANQGAIIDATKGFGSDVFLTNSAGNIAPLSPSFIVDRGLTRLRPGDNRLVVFGNGALTVSGTYWPAYSTAAAGDV